MYCSVNDIRAISGLETDDITDLRIVDIIKFAISHFNKDILDTWEDEAIEFISNEKDNDQDGTNKTFYTINYPLGDKDDDGDVDISDLYVYSIDSDGTRTVYTVSSVDVGLGQFILSTAPPSDEDLYVSYRSSHILNTSTPHASIKYCFALLCSAYCFLGLDARLLDRIRISKINVGGTSKSYDTFFAKYVDLVSKIRKNYEIKEAPYVI